MDDIFNNNAEIALLSIVIKSPSTFYSLDMVREEMFSQIAHKIIWNTIQRVVDKALVPDKDMVINELKITDKLVEAGTESYINYLCTQNYTDSNLQEYLNQLISAYKASGVLSLTSGLADRLLHSSNIDDEISSIRQRLDKLQDLSSAEESESIDSMADEIKEKIIERTNNPGKVGTTFGISDVDIFTGGVEPTNLWVIAGRPSMGKTAAAVNSMLNSAKDGNGVLLFSLESNRQKIVERFVAIDCDVPLQDIHLGTLDQKQLKKVSASLDSIRKLPIYVDTNFTPSLEYIIATIRRMVKQKNVKLVYIDYIQLLSGRGDDVRLEIGRIMRGLKLLAVNLNIGIIILAQLNRACESRDDKRPLLSDLKESGDIEQDADLVAFLYRDYYYNKDTKFPDMLEFIIRKYRDGAIGTLLLTMEMTTNKIGDKNGK
jgi:replicative DNA helicase